MRLRFIKCHGSGNDFPLVDARDLDLDDAAWGRVTVALSDRSGPVGSDGLLLLTGTVDAPEFRMFNADGTEAETCLNGVRCVARAAFEASGRQAAVLRLIGSEVAVERAPDLAPDVYTVRERARGSLSVRDWPMEIGAAELIDGSLPALDPAYRFTAIAMPNPHLVAFVDPIDEADLVRIGLRCEAAPPWLPRRANVSFVALRPDGIFVRTHERGVGLTDSCGSAMAAAAFAACLTGRWRFGEPMTVWNRGGLVRASAGPDGVVTLDGNATFEWEGSVEVDAAAGTATGLHVDRHHPREIAAWSHLTLFFAAAAT